MQILIHIRIMNDGLNDLLNESMIDYNHLENPKFSKYALVCAVIGRCEGETHNNGLARKLNSVVLCVHPK